MVPMATDHEARFRCFDGFQNPYPDLGRARLRYPRCDTNHTGPARTPRSLVVALQLVPTAKWFERAQATLLSPASIQGSE